MNLEPGRCLQHHLSILNDAHIRSDVTQPPVVCVVRHDDVIIEVEQQFNATAHDGQEMTSISGSGINNKTNGLCNYLTLYMSSWYMLQELLDAWFWVFLTAMTCHLCMKLLQMCIIMRISKTQSKQITCSFHDTSSTGCELYLSSRYSVLICIFI